MPTTKQYTLGLDLGGSGGRCLFLDLESGAVLRTARAWSAKASPGGAADLDLERVWSLLGEAIREGLGLLSAKPEDVIGVAAASMRFGSVILDEADRVLLAAPNHDARGVAAALQLAGEHGEALEASGGHWPAPVGLLPRLLSMPAETRARARCAFSVNDWVALRLCGERATDPTQASGTLLLDLAQGSWSSSWIDRLGLNPAIFPSIQAPGQRLGTLRADAAEALGLSVGTPVSMGGGDTQLGLVGLGSLAEGDAAAICGTTLPVQVVVEGPPPSRPGLWVEPHAVPGRFVVESNAGPVGDAIDWLGHLLAPNAPGGGAWLLAQAGAGTPGAGGMLSTFGTQVMDARAMRLPNGDLTLSHLGEPDPAKAGQNLARAVTEGIAFSLRANLEQVTASPASLRLGGRMSESETLARTVAAVCGTPVERGTTGEATALGAALCAAVGAGVYTDLHEAASATEQRERFEPDPNERELLSPLYERWCELQELRRPATDVTQALAIQGMLRGAATAGVAEGAPGNLRILVTADMDADALSAFEQLGDVEYASYRDAKRLLTGPTLVEALQGFDVFVTEIDLVDAGSLLELPDLRVVASCRGDAVNVDVEACSLLGVPVLNAPGRNADAVADLTLAFLLALARKLPEANAFLREPGMEPGDMGAMGRAYGQLRGQELWRRRVGLVGFGAVGRKVAERLLPFGSEVCVYDPWQEREALIRAGVTPVSLETLLEESDFVSLHAAVTEESTGLIGADAFARMKNTAALVNTARAALVDEDALVSALQGGEIAGAALDVFSVEPPGSDHPLLAEASVLATPHLGGNTQQIGAHQGRIVSQDLARLIRGEPTRCALNPDVAAGLDWSEARVLPDAATCAELRDRPPPAVTDLQKKKETAPRKKSPTLAPPAPAAVAVDIDPVRRDEMEARLARFVEAFAHDPAAAAAAADQAVTLHFVLEDVGLEFCLGLRGNASGALGPPSEEAEVVLRLESAVLDRMFGGESRAMDEAMAGNLSFSGDAGKAMTLQQLEADLIRLYSSA